MELSERLFKHNSGFYDKTYSAFTSDWDLFLRIDCISVNQAIQIEKHIKRMKSKVYIENLKKYPEMVDKLLNLY
jgi:putative endonuclease